MSEQAEGTRQPEGSQISGMLVRGPDGHLYFIPDDQLQAFRVPDKGRDLMTEKLLQSTPAVHTSIPTHWPTMMLCAIQQIKPPDSSE